MRPPRASSRRVPLLALVALDVMLGYAVYRLPARLRLPVRIDAVPAASPGFAGATDDNVFFVLTPPQYNAETVLVRIPLRSNGRATARVIGRDLGLLEPVRSLDAFMPTGPRWAWNGATLLLCAPARGLGANRVSVLLLGRDGLLLPARIIDGTRPSCGWAADHFEVAYVTPAPSPDAGRVQRVVDISREGGASNERIVSTPGTMLDPFAWPRGVRTHVSGVSPEEIILPDGSARAIPRERGRVARPVFDLMANGATRVAFARGARDDDANGPGDGVERVRIGDLEVTARVGPRVARPRFDVTRNGRRIRFETDIDARVRDLVATERAGVLHLVDPRGFHVRLRADDLAPLDPRMSRAAFLAGVLGLTSFAALLAATVLAHVLAWVFERAMQGRARWRKYGSVAWLAMVLAAGASVALVWSAGS